MSPVNTKLGSKAGAALQLAVVSLNPETFTSGGLLDDVDVVVKDAAFLMWDYSGKVAVAVPALGITFRLVGEENDPDESKDHDQYYSCGKPEDFAPTADGSALQIVGAKQSLNNNSNGGLFLASLVAVGVPKSVFETNNIKALTGMRLHVNRVPAPERVGLEQREGQRKPEVLVATKLLALPGEGAGSAQSKSGLSKVSPGKANGAASTAINQSRQTPVQGGQTSQSAGNASSGTESNDDELTAVVLEIALAAGGSIAKKLIGPKVFAAYKGRPDQAQAMRRAASDDFLMGLGEVPSADGTAVYTFAYDGATLTAVANE